MIDTLRSAAHLQREIGDDLFAVLVSSDHTEAVRGFAANLLASAPPTTITIGDREYDILGFLRGDKKSVKGGVMVRRAKEANAHLGCDDGEHLLAHKDEIPAVLREKVVFVFTDWPHPEDPGSIAFVYWNGDRWVQGWGRLDGVWHGDCRVLRRHRTRAPKESKLSTG